MTREPAQNRASRSGYTLLELLIVVTIIALLAAIGTATGSKIITPARKMSASTQIAAIEQAILNYEMEYQRFPLLPSDSGTTTGYGGTELLSSNAYGSFMDALAGEKNSPPSEVPNTRGTSFLTPNYSQGDPPRSGINVSLGDMQWNDPWGNPFIILLDSDYDGKLVDPFDSTSLWRSVMILSAGPNHPQGSVTGFASIDPTLRDIVYSWKD